MSDVVPGQQAPAPQSELEALRQQLADLRAAHAAQTLELNQLRQRVGLATQPAPLDESPEFLASWRR